MIISDWREVLITVQRLHRTVKNKRERMNLSQRELAKQCGLNHSTISRYESSGRADGTTIIALLQWMEQQVTLSFTERESSE